MSGVKSSNIIGGDSGQRQANDYYGTPPECTNALLRKELSFLKGKKVLEPCCGKGFISEILIANGLEVESSDLIDRGYGTGDIDFLKMTSTTCTAVVTNPPFNLAEEFIRHSLDILEVEYLAVLVKAHYWHAKRRHALFRDHPPAVIYAMTWRPDFLKKGAPTMDFIWTVWRKSEHPTEYAPLDKS